MNNLSSCKQSMISFSIKRCKKLSKPSRNWSRRTTWANSLTILIRIAELGTRIDNCGSLRILWITSIKSTFRLLSFLMKKIWKESRGKRSREHYWFTALVALGFTFTEWSTCWGMSSESQQLTCWAWAPRVGHHSIWKHQGIVLSISSTLSKHGSGLKRSKRNSWL